MATNTTNPIAEPISRGKRDYEEYEVLAAYYRRSRLYEVLGRHVKDSGYSALRGLRNPAEAAVEFHAAIIWGCKPSTLKVLSEDGTQGNNPLSEPLLSVWKWSNLDERGKVAARWFPMLGDLLVKIAKPDGREQVVVQFIDPKHLTDFDKDERGYFTYLRLDIKSERRKADGEVESYWHVEVWRKQQDSDGSYRVYEHDGSQGERPKEERLGDAKSGAVLSENRTAGEQGVLGFDFIPFVHAKFRDVGDARGCGVFAPYVEDIDEANRLATRLHEMLFRYNRAHKGLKSEGTDASGAPLPQPRVDPASRQQQQQGYSQAGYYTDRSQRPDEVELGGERFTLFPANVSPVDLTPNVDYSSALTALDKQMDFLAEQMPELLYYRIHEKGEMSGRALRTLLSGAIDRASEARDNLEAALVRADEMALTLGQLYNVPGFERERIGTYENGDFAHTFAERPILAESPEDEIDRRTKQADLLVKLKQLGVSPNKLFEEAGVEGASGSELDIQRLTNSMARAPASGEAESGVSANGDGPPNEEP